MTTSCTFTPTSSVSTKIPTVGIVTWSTSLPGVTEAHIDFGLTTSYGLTAPVDLTHPSYRTLLLGMKASKTYHYRIEVSGGGDTCTSGDYTIATGGLMNGLPTLIVTTNNASALYGGFLVTGEFVTAGGAPAYILDADGDYVWWYNAGSDAAGVRMSYDGNYMWINSYNTPDVAAHVHRVTMDGLTDTDFSVPFAHAARQIAPLPDGSVAFHSTGSNGCDDIMLFPAGGTPTSTATLVVNSRVAHGGTAACNVKYVAYSQSDDTLVFADRGNDCLTKVSRTTGATVWVLGGINGITSSFTGDSWQGGEAGFQILGLDDFLIFNNNTSADGGGGTGAGSIALELRLNLTAMTSAKIWSYTASPGIQNDVLGDVQRLPNGNTVIDYSTKSTIQEVDASGNVLQQLRSATVFGYIEKRATLYGPPSR